MINPMMSPKMQPSENQFTKHFWQPVSISTLKSQKANDSDVHTTDFDFDRDRMQVIEAQTETGKTTFGWMPNISALAAAMYAQACLTHSIPEKKE